MREHIRESLKQHAESSYKEFSSALIPESRPLLGVRLPMLRTLAKEIVKSGDWRSEIASCEGEYEDKYFEETMLRGMIIGYGTEKGELQEGLSYVAGFIPHVDNWSTCDSFCTSFLLAGRHRAEVWEFLQKYLYSEKEFEVRVAVITLLAQYLKYDGRGKKLSRKRAITMKDVERDTYEQNRADFPYMERILEVLNRQYTQGYYAQMAAAWTTAESFVTFPYETAQMLTGECRLDDWTYNKALQKICESRNPDEEVKAYARSLKR